MKAIFIEWKVLNELMEKECPTWSGWETMMDENGTPIGNFMWTSDFTNEDNPKFSFQFLYNAGNDIENMDRCNLEDYVCGGAVFFQKPHYTNNTIGNRYKRNKPVLCILPYVGINNLP